MALPVHAATLALAACLLFWVQPMFGKLALPLLGGAPAVWNTAMVFFQTMLLAGYGYAHFLARVLTPRWQAVVHAGVAAVAFAALPVALPRGWEPPTGSDPTLWLLILLSVSVGLPFFAISATAPLVQHWFSRGGHSRADDPYFLYAASNAGSIIGLFGYPLLVEPALALPAQTSAWSAGFVSLAVFLVGCGTMASRAASSVAAREPAGCAPAPLLRLRWLALAAVPSSLLLGVTSHVTTDIAAVPLLWVVPLALYLLSFVLGFAQRPPISRAVATKAQAIALIPLVLTFAFNLLGLLALHLAAFFLTALVCHGELARSRPHAGRLTEFYLWISAGGAIGGMANALLAPVLFDSVLEYPLALVAACLLRPRADTATDVKAMAVFGAGAALLGGLLLWRMVPSALAIPVWALMLTCAGMYLWIGRGSRLALAAGTAGVLALGAALVQPGGQLIERHRGFFGVHRVMLDAAGPKHLLLHGGTIHGMQYLDPERRRIPLSYYHPDGPLGEIFAAVPRTPGSWRVGVVGLGAGATACYGHPGEEWRFFEIDPLVERIARDPRLFTFLAECTPDAPVIQGDARLTVAREPNAGFDLLILDAFSADSIPMHLMTREAMAMYLSKLKPDGWLVIHVSNRYLRLARPVADLLADAGWAGRICEFNGREDRPDAAPAHWVAAARNPAALAGLGEWQQLPTAPRDRVWTDSWSGIVGILKIGS